MPSYRRLVRSALAATDFRPPPYARYHGFLTQEAPVPGPAVIMHCSSEVKAQVGPAPLPLPL